jgi:hypothetical protein
MLVLDIIDIIPPLGKYKFDTWRILLVKCYIDNSVCLQSCIRNVNNGFVCFSMLCLCILTLLRILRYDLVRQTPHL